MENPIEQSMNGAVNQCLTAEDGATKHGETIGLKHATAAVLLAARLAAIAARILYEAGKKLVRTRRTELETALDTARAFAMLARDNLKPILGNEYSEAWNEAGFINSIAVPRFADEMVPLMQTLTDYLKANPAVEVEKRNITAVRCEELFNALRNANSAVQDQEGAVSDLMKDRDDKFEAVRECLRTLLDELSHLIGPLDGRWLAFGFNKPGAEETPDVPDGFVVTMTGPTSAAMKWNPAARGAYYHVWKKVDGVDAELVSVGSPTDLGFMLENLPANSTIQVAVSAINDGGESQPCQPIQITTH